MTSLTPPAGLPGFHIMAKPIGPVCNLKCAYCFYLEKTALYPDTQSFRMSDATLEQFVRTYIEAQEVPQIEFAWQGGEPTLMGLDFLKRAVELQTKYANGKRITNALQTNGLLLDDDWCRFFKDNCFLIGLSIDGPPELHNRCRLDAQGTPSFDRVVRALELMNKHGVEYNALTVVSAANERHPVEVYQFLKQYGVRFMQFIPLVERMADDDARSLGLSLAMPAHPGEHVKDPIIAPWAVHPDAYGKFLIDVFEEWVGTDVGTIFVQFFDVALGAWMGHPASLCVFADRCGTAMILEHNGDLFSCDHFAYPEYRIGNINESRPLRDIVSSPFQTTFGCSKHDALPRCCLSCDVRFACNGDCPKHRFITSTDGDPNLSYLCPAYKMFFHYIDPYMQVMGKLLSAGQPASAIMDIIRQHEQAHANRPPRRNDPCPCGSGKKFKHCCAAKQADSQISP